VERHGIHFEESPDTADEPTLPIPVPDEPTVELPIVAIGRQRMPRWPGALAGVIAAGVLGLLVVQSGDAPPAAAPPTPTWRAGTGSPEAETITIAGGSAAITLQTADLGGARYRVTPAGTRVTESGGVLRVEPGSGAVDVTLAARVRWRLALDGADRSSVDLSRARLAAVDLAGGSAIDLTLPRPDGTLTVTMTGGVDRLGLRTAGRVPVRVRVGNGAGRVVLDGSTHDGVAAGALFTPAGWDGAADRIDVDAVAGMAALTVASY
jgi:hypothetical protein